MNIDDNSMYVDIFTASIPFVIGGKGYLCLGILVALDMKVLGGIAIKNIPLNILIPLNNPMMGDIHYYIIYYKSPIIIP